MAKFINIIKDTKIVHKFVKRSEVDIKLQEFHADLSNVKNCYAINNFLPLNPFQSCVEQGCNTGSLAKSDALFLLEKCIKAVFTDGQTRQKLSKLLWNYILKEKEVTVNHFNAYLTNVTENKFLMDESKYLGDMKSRNIAPNSHTYSKLVEYYCQNGKVNAAKDVIDKMERSNFKIGQNIYNNLIRGYARARNSKGCLEILNLMKEKEIETNMKTYNELLLSYAELNLEQDFKNVLKEAINKGVPISSQTLIECYVSFCFHNNKDCMHLVRIRIPSNLRLYKVLRPIEKLLQNQYYDEALSLMEEVPRNSSLVTDLITYHVPAEKAFKYGKHLSRNFTAGNLCDLIFHYATYSSFDGCEPFIKEFIWYTSYEVVPTKSVKGSFYYRQTISMADFILQYDKYLQTQNKNPQFCKDKLLNFVKEVIKVMDETKKELDILDINLISQKSKYYSPEAAEFLTKCRPFQSINGDISEGKCDKFAEEKAIEKRIGPYKDSHIVELKLYSLNYKLDEEDIKYRKKANDVELKNIVWNWFIVLWTSPNRRISDTWFLILHKMKLFFMIRTKSKFWRRRDDEKLSNMLFKFCIAISEMKTQKKEDIANTVTDKYEDEILINLWLNFPIFFIYRGMYVLTSPYYAENGNNLNDILRFRHGLEIIYKIMLKSSVPPKRLIFTKNIISYYELNMPYFTRGIRKHTEMSRNIMSFLVDETYWWK